ncbi:MAG: hypothetical protein H6720_26460 [Sandaracinus sp.]|nr:hypothetical protein [Sandaracinus sp.]
MTPSHRACSMVEALTRLEDPRSTDVLVETFERTTYAYARPRVLRALAACRSNALEALATEALWDCDAEAREVAACHAPRMAEVRTRIDTLRGDALESAGVHAVLRLRDP